MAVNVSENYRTTVYGGERIYSCSLSINNTPISSSQIKQINISRPIIDKTKDSYYIGTFIADKVEITFKNTQNLNIASGDEVSLNIALKVNGTDEWVNQGIFIIDDLGENYQKSNKITCYDYSIKFEPAVNTPIEDVFNHNVDADTYSITLENLLIWLCNHYGVTLGTYPEINNDIVVGNWDSTISGKQYVSWIAEMMAGNAKIGRDGKLNIISLNSPYVYNINGLKSKSWELGERYQISKVIYFDAVRNYTFPLENMFELTIQNNGVDINTTGCSVTLDNNVYTFTSEDTDMLFGDLVEENNNYYAAAGVLYSVNPNDVYEFICSNNNFRVYVTEYDENKVSLGARLLHYNDFRPSSNSTKYVSFAFGIYGIEQEDIGEEYETSVIFREFVAEETNTLQIRQDNLLVVSEEEIKNIYDSVKGFTIWSIKNENFGDLSLDAYDRVRYSIGNNVYGSFYNPEITYTGSVMVKTEVKIPTKQQEITTNKSQLDSQASVRKVQTEVNSLTGQITLLSQKTTENTSDITTLQISDNEIKTSIINVTNSTSEQINELTTALNETKTATYTKTEIQQIAEGTYEDEHGNLVAVSNVINASGTFDIDGMHYSKTGAATDTTINQNGLEIDSTSSGSELLYAGYDTNPNSDTYGTSVVRTENLTVKKYLRCGGIGRFEPYRDNSYHNGVGFFLEG